MRRMMMMMMMMMMVVVALGRMMSQHRTAFLGLGTLALVIANLKHDANSDHTLAWVTIMTIPP